MHKWMRRVFRELSLPDIKIIDSPLDVVLARPVPVL